MSEENVSLYEDWKKLYPRYQTGFFRNLRWGLVWLFMLIYMGLPLLRWQRAGDLPDQAVLIDLPGRKFYLFDLVIWPQEVFLLAILLIVAAVLLFFMTALAGRVFCGYMCFQTVWTDMFLYVEKVFEGNRKQRIKLDTSPWGVNKLLKKTGKHLVWLLISVLTGLFFVFYFADAPTLTREFLDGTAPGPAWVTVLLLTVSTYAMAGFAREQVCIYMCPYSRFQGAMFDEDTLIIAYHPEVGEPRQSNRRIRNQQGSEYGLCIDCNSCVTVCPTGIDIRDGQQYQCITCGACIDACVEVKERANMPIQLIRYTSMREMAGQPTQYMRFRILAYAVIMSILMGGILYYFFTRPPMELSVLRQRQPLYIAMSDGSIQNNYTVRVLNMTRKVENYQLKLAGLDHATVVVAATDEGKEGSGQVLTVGPGEVMPFTVYVRQSPPIAAGPADVRFVLTSSTGDTHTTSTVFARP
ncbi:MAG: cytochrome c oxidase accessory protein CcoG [Magnetococcales bacterium]|nr:cytochrome c oxidase accessory protein CcoG [Magnetococcales bacterium]NGZ26684.1 cytochrome c oxidase accessory protein CcoG [Magnetococcales bacterium]